MTSLELELVYRQDENKDILPHVQKSYPTVPNQTLFCKAAGAMRRAPQAPDGMDLIGALERQHGIIILNNRHRPCFFLA